TRTPLVRP
ncbi:hypothetical protein MKD33_20280, partial [Chromobacterium piscinae]